MSGCNDGCGTDFGRVSPRERRTLGVVLLLNAAMFVAEFSAGLAAGSTALLADSLDMLADALIYALGLFAMRRAAYWRARAALASGLFQLVLGIGVSLDAVSKLIVERIPDPGTMGLFGILALLVNTICFLLLLRYRKGEINLRATWICSRNDMLGNIGVLVAAALVGWLDSMWPDILIGLFIAMVVIMSALRIGLEAWGVMKNTA